MHPAILRYTARFVPVVASVVLASCAPERASERTLFEPQVLAAKAATPAADPNAYYSFADSVNVAAPGADPVWSPAGIRGDGRLKNGAASVGSPSNEYQGAFCGVYAVVGYQKQGKGTFNTDPDIDWTSAMQPSCGSARLFGFYLAGLTAAPTLAGPHSVLDTLAVLSAGQVSARMAKFGVQLPNCDGIRFGKEYPPAADAKVTRLPDVLTSSGALAAQWRVESQGSHRGACVMRTKSGSIVATGVSYYLPFAITITEVPQPAASFP